MQRIDFKIGVYSKKKGILEQYTCKWFAFAG